MRSGEAQGLSWPVRAVYVILASNAVAAVLSLTLAPGSEDLFTWTIVPDASARMLAVMYLNAFLLVTLAWTAGGWARTRAVFVLVTAFSITATLVTVTNFGPFLAHPWYHQAYWLGAYAVLFVVTPVVLVREERARGGRLPVEDPLSGATRAVGALSAVALGAAGLALIVDPAGLSDAWPWPIAPLVGRVLAVWLLSLAVTYAWVLRDGDWGRGRAVFLTAPVSGAGLILVLLAHGGDVGGGSVAPYLVLALLLAANGLAVASQRAVRVPLAAGR